jgi:transposase
MRGSGDTSHYGRITKDGDQEMRRLLVQAADALMLTLGCHQGAAHVVLM